MLSLISASAKLIYQAMICRILIQTQTVASYYNCTASYSQCGKSLIRAFEIKNDRKTKNLNEGDGFYQTLRIRWTDK